jgi:hypothetical protein
MAKTIYTSAQMLTALRSVSKKAGKPLSVTKYDQNRDKSTQPSSARIIQTLGSWSEAVRAAGLRPNQPSREYFVNFDEEDVLLWVRRYLAKSKNPSYQDFSEWLQQYKKAPAAQTCRNILGSWSQILDLARRS